MADNRSVKRGSDDFPIDLENFSKRLKVFYDHWKEHKSDLWSSSNTVVIATPREVSSQHLKSKALEIWLLGYEFPETIIVFMDKQIHVLCSQKKANLIETLKKAADEAIGADIVLHVKSKNSDASNLMDDIVRAANTQSKPHKPVFGHVAKEVDGGKLLEAWAAKLSSYGIRPADVTNGLSELFAVKDTVEVTCVKKAAYFTSSVLTNFVVPKLLKVIVEERKVSHSSLSDETEKAILDPHKIKVKLKPDNVDICYPPVFQSGGKFNLEYSCYPLKPDTFRKDDNLYYDSASVIICAIGSKYSSYCSNVARTYLIDATPKQSKAYETLLKAHEAAIEKVKPGNQLSAVYQAAVAVIKRDAPELLPNITESAGSGIGLEFRESVLYLSANDREIKQGMIFNVSLGLHNINAETCEETKQFSLLLADTVLVTERGQEILTATCSKAVKDVAYCFSKEAVRIELMKNIMDTKENIRNVCIFAPGQPNIVKALSSDPTLLAPEMMNDTIAREDEHMALYYKLGKGPRNSFLVNTQCPKVFDSSLEFNTSLSIADGALMGVELNQGFNAQCESFLRQALYESIVPLLCIDLPDIEDFLKDLKEDEQAEAYGEQIYVRLSQVIKKANDIVGTYENKLLCDVTFDPRKGNVCFFSSSSGWVFTLDDMAHFWAPLLCMEHSILLERFWGDSFYDPNSESWSALQTETSKRGFVHFCFNLIMTILEHCLKGDLGKYEVFFGGTVKDKQQFAGKVGMSLYKEFISKFLPASTTFLKMVICKLPSPQRAQRYRVEHLYSGPMNDTHAAVIRACTSIAPLMLHISNFVIDAESGEPIAFGRIYSGSISAGMEVDILCPSSEVVGKKLKVQPIIWIGKRQQQAQSVCCGNIIGIRGIHQTEKMGCTVITKKKSKVFPLRPISFYLMNNMEIKDVTLESIIPGNSKCFSLPYMEYSSLFPHQRGALDWLWELHLTNKGGILADDMGLGKTRQVSAFLRGLFYSNMIKKAIIIAPLSVIYHWEPELKKVGLQSEMFTKGNSELHLNALENVGQDGGIILTTYETIRDHKDKISEKLGIVDYIFADEGHKLKNYKVGASEALEKIKRDHCILVTGTPIPNNLMEFYTLMKFCNPTLLGNKEDFKEIYFKPIDEGKYKGSTPRAIQEAIEAKKALSNLVAPFILRRSKMILKDSGRIKTNKYEMIIWIKLSCHQVNLYEALMLDPNPMLKKIGGALKVYKVAKGLCMDPSVVGMASANNISQKFKNTLLHTVRTLTRDVTSSKLSFLLYFLPLLRSDKHKILVFSTSKKMLIVLEKALSAVINEEIIRMDGTTNPEERVKLVEKFQHKDGPPIFLLTTKVGGEGITLTSATRVIVVDPSDNPCDDNQALDRAYRIGQQRDVIVYRLITCGAIEENIYERQILKLETSDDVLQGTQGKGKISKKKGYVLRIPPQGFGVSERHLKLVEMYGNNFDRSLELAKEAGLVKKHTSVFDVFNQSAINSLPKDVHSLKGQVLERGVKKKKKKCKLEESSQIDHGGNSDLPTDPNNGLSEADKMGDGGTSRVLKVYQRRKKSCG